MTNEVFILRRGREYKVKPPTACLKPGRSRDVRFCNLTGRPVTIFFPDEFLTPEGGGPLLRLDDKTVEGTARLRDGFGRGDYSYAVFVGKAGVDGDFATGESSPHIIVDG